MPHMQNLITAIWGLLVKTSAEFRFVSRCDFIVFWWFGGILLGFGALVGFLGLIGGFLPYSWQIRYRSLRYDSLVCAALEFLSAICQRPQYEAMFREEGVLRTIALDVACKNLILRFGLLYYRNPA